MHEEEARSVRKFPRKALAVLGVVVIVASGVVVAAATASTKSHKASVQVCVLLPDTKSSVRWVQFDAPAMKAAFAKAGVTASIEKLCTSKGGKAIDYDRQVTGGSASVYVTFDGKAVGAAQAKGVVAAMKANGTYAKKGVVAELWGGQTDQNAFWFKSGNDAVFNPLFASKALTK